MNRRTSAWVATHAPTGTRWGTKTLSLLLSLALCLTLLPGAAFAADEEAGITGTDTADDPILISSVQDLKAFAQRVNNGETTLCATLTEDIDLAGSETDPWEPIGNADKRYSGTFDGDGHTIKGLYVTGKRVYAGLFGFVVDATIRNVTVDGYVSASGDNEDWCPCTGGIVGAADVNTRIENCTNLSTVKSDFTKDGGSNYVGGIAGNLYLGTIINCRNSGKVILEFYTGTAFRAGGIVGFSRGQVSSCCNTGAVIANSKNTAAIQCLNIGGVVGTNGTNGTNAKVESCYNTGAVTVTGTFTIIGDVDYTGFGGVVGFSNGTVSKCYNTGAVSCDKANVNVGGVAGVNYNSTVTYCYSLYDTATEFVGISIRDATTAYSSNSSKAEFANGTVLNELQNGDENSPWTTCGYLEAAKMTLPLLNWQTADDHTHSVQTGICTEGIKCTCGYEMYAPTSKHNWGEWVHDTTSHRRGCDNPGCGMTQSGNCSGGTATCKEQATCTVCGGKYGALADHSFTAENTDEQYLKTAATCTAKAVYYKSCAVCGLSSKDTDDEATFESGEVDASSHTGGLGSWQSNAEKHWKEYSCCGAKSEEADHVYTDAADTTCDTCGYTRAVHYAITFNANGGTLASGEETQQTNAVGKLASLPTPTRSGSYRFDGWYTEKSGGTRVTTETVFKADTTVYAHWTYTGGSGSYMPSYAVTVEKSTNGSVSADRKTASRGTTVTITVTPDRGYTLETLTVTDRNGNEQKLTNRGDGKYSFAMPSSEVTVRATFMDDNTMLNFFVDVKASDYYYDAVLWAAQKGITSGTDAAHFSPSLPCTRAQIVTFLWRAAGSPVVNYAMNMTDVSTDAYYAEAVRWALSEGITTGTTATTFSPNETCTRAQAVAFLFRYAAPAAVTLQELVSSFSDAASVPGYALSAMNWALADGIVQGDGSRLLPSDFCTRAQIVTFLYRALEK